jgi:hypothetical protein
VLTPGRVVQPALLSLRIETISNTGSSGSAGINLLNIGHVAEHDTQRSPFGTLVSNLDLV